MKWDEGTIDKNTNACNDRQSTDQKEPVHFIGLVAIKHSAFA